MEDLKRGHPKVRHSIYFKCICMPMCSGEEPNRHGPFNPIMLRIYFVRILELSVYILVIDNWSFSFYLKRSTSFCTVTILFCCSQMLVVYFNQSLGAGHFKYWLKSPFPMFLPIFARFSSTKSFCYFWKLVSPFS